MPEHGTPPLAYCAGCGKPLWAGDEMCPPGCGKPDQCAAPGCDGDHEAQVTVEADDTHECVFVEEQEPSGRLILPPCIVCGLTAMDALEQLRGDA